VVNPTEARPFLSMALSHLFVQKPDPGTISFNTAACGGESISRKERVPWRRR
jgi:hypothetical protein